MRLLLDTHAFLWWVFDDPKVSPAARDLIADPAAEILFSVVNAWEIVIKARAGRLDLPADAPGFVADQVRRNAFRVLPVELRHALQVHRLPDHHKDPFDRLLVAQAQVEAVPVVSCDPLVATYEVETRW
jgi:PIN domain nuclease of toxin-antitoxin system